MKHTPRSGLRGLADGGRLRLKSWGFGREDPVIHNRKEIRSWTRATNNKSCATGLTYQTPPSQPNYSILRKMSRPTTSTLSVHMLPSNQQKTQHHLRRHELCISSWIGQTQTQKSVFTTSPRFVGRPPQSLRTLCCTPCPCRPLAS